jgi:hypothetical protein
MSHTSLGDGHVQLSLGLYVMGTLPKSERVAVKAHLSECAQCRDECIELTEMPSLLAMLTDANIQTLGQLGAAPESPPRPGLGTSSPNSGSPRSPSPNRLRSAPARPPRHATAAADAGGRGPKDGSGPAATSARGRGRRVLVVAAAVIAVIVASALGISTWVESSEQSINTTLTADATDPGTGASLSVVVNPEAGGARVQATVYGLRPGQEYQLFGVSVDGQTQVVSHWTGTAEANTVVGHVTGAPNRLAFVTVALLDGTPVVSVRVAR